MNQGYQGQISDRRRGQGAFALLALLAATHLATFLHAGAARHARCLEHGEIIEAHGEPAPQPLGDAPALTIDLTVVAAAHGHDHCAILSAARSLAIFKREAALAIAARARAVAPMPAPSSAETRPIFRLAPKQSPPA